MSSDDALEYTDEMVEGLELLWGEGFLAPGGREEIRCLLEGIEVEGLNVLDIGCGLGEPSCTLVEQHGVGRVTALDIEAPTIRKARERALARGLAERVDFRVVEPGPLPFDDGEFDLVFSKDAIVHVADKTALFRECHRVLREGGHLVMSDWFGGDRPKSPEMEEWLKMEANYITLHLTTLGWTASALQEIGFEQVTTQDRNAWYRGYAEQEVRQMSGPLRESFVAKFGEEEAQDWLNGIRERKLVVDQGHLRPGHLRGRKPA